VVGEVSLAGNGLALFSPADLLEGIQTGIAVVDRERRLLFVNSWWSEKLGRSADSLVGHFLDEWLIADDRDVLEHSLDLLFDKGQIVRWQSAIRLEGGTRTAEFTATPIRRDEKVVAAQVNCQDVSDQRQREQEADQDMQALHELSSALQSSLDLHNVLNAVVKGVVTLLGYHLALLAVVDEKDHSLVVRATYVHQAFAAATELVTQGPLHEARISLDEPQPLVVRALHESEMTTTDSLSDLLGMVIGAEAAGDIQERLGIRCLAAVPLRARGRLVGNLIVGTGGEGFSERQRSLLSSVASQSAMAIENAHLYDTVHQRLDEVSTLYMLANQASSSLDLDVVLDLIVGILKRVLNCRGSVIFLLDENREWLEVQASSGISPHWQREARMRLGEGIGGKVALKAKPLYIPDTYRDPNFIVFDPSVRSLLVVPLIYKGQVIGTLNVDDDHPDAFSEDVSRLLSIAAAQVAAAIYNAKLYEGLKERAQKLAEAHKELQESDRLKSEFVQNTSHELRTPLTFVKGYVELLLEGTLGPLTGRQRESLGIVADWTDKIIQLVNAILTLQQIERGDLRLSSVSLIEIARVSMQSARATAQQAGLTLVEDFEPALQPVWGDRTRLEQVFVNLVGNAIKFSPQGGTITVRLRNEDGVVRADVIDQGIGIASEQLARIFERFYQVDGSSKRRFGGTGLGLAIVKEIVEAHSGTVTVESEPGVGSKFSFTVPFAPDQAALSREQVHQEAQAAF
jgi:PAS domain S-box-containing protein